MRIVINTLPLLSPLTGIGNYIYHLLKIMKSINNTHDYTYFYGYFSKRLITYEDTAGIFHMIKEFMRKITPLGNRIRNMIDLLTLFNSKVFDIYFEPNFIPLNIDAKKIVVTVMDFSFKVNPSWHPHERVNYFENRFWKEIHRADHIIVPSRYIRDSALEFLKSAEGKICIINPGINHDIFKLHTNEDLKPIKAKYNLPMEFILFVGTLEPRKNIKNLIAAYKNIENPPKLVIAGCKGWLNREGWNLLKSLKGNLIFIEYISSFELGKLYNLASLFVFPSLYEGFGLPPLEAMACGCPVIVSNVASLPEVCGDAAYYVDPYSIEDIEIGIERVLTDEDLRRSLIKKGLERVKLFSWEKAAREHIKVFEEALNN